MENDRDIQLLKAVIKQLSELDMVVKDKLRTYLRGKSREEIRHALDGLDKHSLEVLCEMSLPHEDYEICQIAHELMNNTTDNNRASA